METLSNIGPVNVNLPEIIDCLDTCPNVDLSETSPGDYFVKGPGYDPNDGGDSLKLNSSSDCRVCFDYPDSKYIVRSIKVFPYNGRYVNTNIPDSEPMPPLGKPNGGEHINNRDYYWKVVGNNALDRTSLYVPYDLIKLNGTWHQRESGYTVVLRWKLVPSSFTPECPPGMEYDPRYGICVPKPGYEWDGKEYVPETPGIPQIPVEPPGILPEPGSPDTAPGEPQNCYVVRCDLPIQVELSPDDKDSIVPPGYNSKLTLSKKQYPIEPDPMDDTMVCNDDNIDTICESTISEECITPDEGPE